MPDPIVDDPEFEPADALLEEVMARLPAPSVPCAPTGRRRLAAALLVLGCAVVAGASFLRRDRASRLPAQEPRRAEPQLVVPASNAEFLRLLGSTRSIAITAQQVDSFDEVGQCFMVRDPEPRLEVTATDEIARWLRLLGEAAANAKGQRVDDVVSLVLRLDLGEGRALELVARLDDGTLAVGPAVGPFALQGDLLRELQGRKDELARRRRLLAGKVEDLAELASLPASATVIECRAAPVAQLEPQLLRFRQLQRLTLLPGEGTPDRATLAMLAKLPALAELHLHAGNLADEDLRLLAELPHLRRLALWHADKVTGSGLAVVRQLQSLWLDRAALDTAGMRALASLPLLTELALGFQVEPSRCELLPAFPVLEQLRLVGSFGDDCLPHVLLTKVKALQLSGRFTGAGIGTLTALPSLKELVLGGCSLRDGDLDGVASLRALQRLDLRSTLITQDGAERVRRALPECELLAAPGRIFQVWVRPSADVDDTWLHAHWTPLPVNWLLAGVR